MWELAAAVDAGGLVARSDAADGAAVDARVAALCEAAAAVAADAIVVPNIVTAAVLASE